MNSTPALKVFVGSIPMGATDEEVQTYFRTFAPEARFSFERKPFKNVSSGGYGYLLVSTRKELDMIVSQSHYIGERLLKCGEYFSGDTLNEYRVQLSNRRILIRNVKKTITDKDVEEFFGTFGELDAAYIVKFQSSSRQRSFGYVTFKREEPAKRLLELGKVVINEVEIHILPFLKSTVPRSAQAAVPKSRQPALLSGAGKSKSDHTSNTAGFSSSKGSHELDYYHESWMVGETVGNDDYFHYETQPCDGSADFYVPYDSWDTHSGTQRHASLQEAARKQTGRKHLLSKDAEPFTGYMPLRVSPHQEQLGNSYDYSIEQDKPTSRKYAKFAVVAANHTAENLAFHFCDLEAEDINKAQEGCQEISLTKCDQATMVDSYKNL